ncbi:hypothetical protein [Acetivibrio cellulolyticus]|uniref:hypothetical protein n=1 Tax=Acetivibrio cellulolyticus TaxID=35830 RepID=UPI0001E2F0E4|nr:hypothetical protein [Acetivibrio cellulolyticus]
MNKFSKRIILALIITMSFSLSLTYLNAPESQRKKLLSHIKSGKPGKVVEICLGQAVNCTQVRL